MVSGWLVAIDTEVGVTQENALGQLGYVEHGCAGQGLAELEEVAARGGGVPGGGVPRWPHGPPQPPWVLADR